MTNQHFLSLPVMRMQRRERWIHFLQRIMIMKMSRQTRQLMKKFFHRKNRNDEKVFPRIFVRFPRIQRNTEIIERTEISIIAYSRMPDTSSTSANTTQEESSLLPPTTNLRQSKYARSQATNEQKSVHSKSSIARKTRGKPS
jgi:hypothetical protein